MHLKRWITSLIGLPLLFLLIYKGGSFLFTLFVTGVVLVSLAEYYQVVFSERGLTWRHPLLLTGLVTGFVMTWAAYAGRFNLIGAILILNLGVSGCLAVMRFEREPEILTVLSRQVLGSIYIPLLLCLLVLIRNTPFGVEWIFLIIILIFAGDVGAYYAGSFLGRRKLCPAVSPKKTVEGAVGGLAANVVVGLWFTSQFLPHLPWVRTVLFFLMAGAVGQVGDLFESVVKRTHQVKDSGSLLPGHGGMLDRIDALLFAAPVAYVFKVYIL